MLVLSRKAREELVFPALGITLKVLRIKGSVVQLGIEAPGAVRVLRREALEKGELLPQIAELARTNTDHNYRNRVNSLLLRMQLALDASSTTEGQIEEILSVLSSEINSPAVRPAVEAPREPAKRVLLVDDDANERQLFGSVLKLRGLDVIEAGDGAEALDFLSSQPLPDAVLLDIDMPKLDGEIALRSIRCDPRLSALEVYAVSGIEPRGHALPENCRGFDGWFAKPLDLNRLCDVLCALQKERTTDKPLRRGAVR